MDNSWIIYTVLTVAYIIILVIYFIRRSKSHEKELTNFLQLAQQQLETHKQQATKQADQKVTKAMVVMKKVQKATKIFEDQAQEEYEEIIKDARAERRDILSKAKSEIDQLFKKADKELAEYGTQRQREIEKNLVKLVIAVTEKVVEVTLSESQHKDIIYKALDEIKQKQTRT